MMLPAVARAADEDAQVWTTVTLGGALSGRVLGTVEVSGRFEDDAGRLGSSVVRTAIGYRLGDVVSIHVGYAHLTTNQAAAADVHENRLFQQLNWTIGALAGGTLSARTRFEQRTIEGARDTGLRVRQQLKFELPLAESGVTAVLSTEPYFALNATDWGARAGFDQVRNFAGLNIPFGTGVSVEAGYLSRYQNRAGRDRIDHIVPVTLGVRF